MKRKCAICEQPETATSPVHRLPHTLEELGFTGREWAHALCVVTERQVVERMSMRKGMTVSQLVCSGALVR